MSAFILCHLATKWTKRTPSGKRTPPLTVGVPLSAIYRKEFGGHCTCHPEP